jgi:hypothetical protein
MHVQATPDRGAEYFKRRRAVQSWKNGAGAPTYDTSRMREQWRSKWICVVWGYSVQSGCLRWCHLPEYLGLRGAHVVVSKNWMKSLLDVEDAACVLSSVSGMGVGGCLGVEG